MEDLTGLYASCNTKDKKVCGKIVKPIEPTEQIDTSELVKSLLAQEEEFLLRHKKKHKQRDPEKKKYKKRKYQSSCMAIQMLLIPYACNQSIACAITKKAF